MTQKPRFQITDMTFKKMERRKEEKEQETRRRRSSTRASKVYMRDFDQYHESVAYSKSFPLLEKTIKAT